MKEERESENDYGGLETLSGKEKVQFFSALILVVLALMAFFVKIYFF